MGSIQTNMEFTWYNKQTWFIFLSCGGLGSSYIAFFLVSQLYILCQQSSFLPRQLSWTLQEFHWSASTSKHRLRRNYGQEVWGQNSNLDLIPNPTSPQSFGERMVKNTGRLLLEVFMQMSEEITCSGMFKRNLIKSSHHHSGNFLRVRTPSQSFLYPLFPNNGIEDYFTQSSQYYLLIIFKLVVLKNNMGR